MTQDKAPDAFRTISEVAEWLDTPAHVLRFWESKFTQIRPVKRAGGRRYYRPEDMALLAGIKSLLHEQGMTIKGVQRLLRERGVRQVAGLAPGGDEMGPGEEERVLAETQSAVRARMGKGESPVAAGTRPGFAEAGDPAYQSGPAPEEHAPEGPARPAGDPRVGSWAPDLAAGLPAIAPRRIEDDAVEVLPPAGKDGVLTMLAKLDPARVRARSARIAPLLDRLESLRARMADRAD